MRRILVCIMMLAALAGCVAHGDEKSGKTNLLFVLHAKKAHYANGKLTLIGVSPIASYFSDRPVRKAGTMEMGKFLEGWDTDRPGSFTHNPPNAGLVFFEDSGKRYSDVPLELQAPMYQARQQTLTFDVHFLEEGLHNNVQMEEVSLFIDSIEFDVGGKDFELPG